MNTKYISRTADEKLHSKSPRRCCTTQRTFQCKEYSRRRLSICCYSQYEHAFPSDSSNLPNTNWTVPIWLPISRNACVGVAMFESHRNYNLFKYQRRFFILKMELYFTIEVNQNIIYHINNQSRI